MLMSNAIIHHESVLHLTSGSWCRLFGRAVVFIFFFGTSLRATLASAGESNTCDGQWHGVPAEDPARRFGDFNSLNGVTAISSTDAWAVGQFHRFAGTDYDHALIEHWDGTSWTAMLTPHPALPISILSGVTATASNDAWAVGYEEDLQSGYRTLIEHWDGSTWTIVQDATYKGWLTSGAAIAPDDVWAVGSTDYIGEGLIEHWDGNTWTKTILRDAIFLRGVTAISRNDVWVVGQLSHDGFGDYTYAAHFDGSSWNQVATPSPLQRHDIDQNWLTSVVALASDDVWAVGVVRDPDYGILDRTLVEHWNGARWQVVSSPRQGNNVDNDFWSIAAQDRMNIWAVGSVGIDPDFQPLIEKWDGTSWQPVATPPTGGVLLSAAALGSTMELWSTGNRVKQDRYTGVLGLHVCP
jgi:hypothetical protein